MVTLNLNFKAKSSDDADALTQDISATVACSPSQLIVFAGRAVKVALASRFRGAVKKAEKDGLRFDGRKFVGMVLDAGEIIGATADPAKRVAKAEKATDVLTPEEGKALIERLRKQYG